MNSLCKNEHDNGWGSMQFLVMLLPLELLIAQGAHGIFYQFIPVASLLLHPMLALFIALFFYKNLINRNLIRLEPVVILAISMLAIPSIYHAVLGNELDVRFLLLGVCSLLLGLMLSGILTAGFVTRPLAIGLMLWSITIVFVYLNDVTRFYNLYEWARAYSIDQLVLAMRYPESFDFKLYYPLVSGNWNKASNTIVLASILMMLAIIRDRKSLFLYPLTIFAMSVVSFLSYSRGGMLVSAALGIVFLLLIYKIRSGTKVAWVLGCVFMILPMMLSLVLPSMRMAWFDMQSIEQRISLVDQSLGAFELPQDYDSTQLPQDYDSTQLPQDYDSTQVTLLGFGAGVYGQQMYGNPFSGTHNMIMDLYLAGGIIQVLGFIVLIFYVLYVVARFGMGSVTQMVGGAGVVALLALAFREFDLNYLGVISLPAFLLGWLMGEALGKFTDVYDLLEKDIS